VTGQRADARRNYARVLAAAEAEIAAHGAKASVEQIARRAGVGSGTARRHFPTRKALFEAVFQRRIRDLCDLARTLGGEEDSRAALLHWLDELLAYSLDARGLADTLSYVPLDGEEAQESCASAIEDALAPLVDRAVADQVVRAGVTAHDLLTVVVGIALATENHPTPAAQARRVLELCVQGLSPSP
jgi:AcrR family transcriptional regulator